MHFTHHAKTKATLADGLNLFVFVVLDGFFDGGFTIVVSD